MWSLKESYQEEVQSPKVACDENEEKIEEAGACKGSLDT